MNNSQRLLIICDGFEYILRRSIELLNCEYPESFTDIDAIYLSNINYARPKSVSDIEDEIQDLKIIDKKLLINKSQDLFKEVYRIKKLNRKSYNCIFINDEGDRQFFILFVLWILRLISFSSNYYFCSMHKKVIYRRRFIFFFRLFLSTLFSIKSINLLMNRISMRYRFRKSLGYPDSLVVEPTNLCNLRCRSCITGMDKMKRLSGMMRLENFQRLIDKCGKYIRWLDFSGYGEPFLHKELINMIKYAKSKGVMNIQCDTNANFNFSAGKFGEIVDSGLDYLVISMDGITQDVYQTIRVNGKLEMVKEFIKSLSKAKIQKKSLKPIIIAQMIMTAQNYNQCEDFKNLVKVLNADSYRIKNFWLNDDSYEPDELKSILPNNNRYKNYEIINARIYNLSKTITNFCHVLWDQIFITWDGTAIPCCFDPNATISLGNVFETESIKSVWNGNKYQNLRELICKDKSCFSICKLCPEF